MEEGSAASRTAVLPTILRPRPPRQLERVGAPCDGGYLVDARDLAAADGLISMGIATDWSFEKGFSARRRVPVHAYDGSLGLGYLAARAVRDIFLLRGRRKVAASARLAADYLRFFSGPIRHVRKFVGKVEVSYRRTSATSVSLLQAFDRMRALGVSRVFLKVDIEGSEYSILDQLQQCAGSTTGLAIEFHDCERRMGEIIAFVQHYPLQLVHIHANNYTWRAGADCPGALELTFSSSPAADIAPATLPHPLDRPNDGRTADVAIRFAEAAQYRKLGA